MTHGCDINPGFKVLLASVGLRHQDILRRVGLPEDLLNRSDVRVPTEQFFAFTQAIAEAADDPLLPIRIVESVTVDVFSPPAFAALCSPNLTIGLTRLALFKPLIAPVRLGVESDEEGLHVTFDWSNEGGGPCAPLRDSEALFLVRLARMGTRHHVRAAAFTLPELPTERGAYEAFLQCPIERGDTVYLRFHREDAERPFLTDNSAMWEIFEPELRKRLADLERSASYAARTRSVLIEALPSGQVSLDSVARRLAVSSRTLQRRLAGEGTTFNAVVRETRESLSRHYLGRTQLSYTEIAYLLGFSEPNSFFRAVRAWTGRTPDVIRRSLRHA